MSAGSPPTDRDELPECLNCGAVANDSFCPRCGQSQRDPRRSLAAWLREAFDEIVSIDGRLLRTLILIVTRPGFLTREWIEGRRARYTSPLRVYLIASVAFFAVTLALGFPFAVLPGSRFGGPETSAIYQSATRAWLSELRSVVTLGVIVIVPVTMAILKLLHIRSGRFVVDHLVFSLHFLGFVFLAWTAAWPILMWSSRSDTGLTWVLIAYLVLPLPYLYRSLRVAHGGGRIAAAATTLFIPVVLFVGLTTVGKTAMLDSVRRLGSAAGLYADARHDEANRLFRTWNEARMSGDVEEAGQRLEPVLDFYRRVPSADLSDHDNLHLAELLLAIGDTSGAAGVAARVLDRSPGQFWALGISGLAVGAADRQLATVRLEGYLAGLQSADSATVAGYQNHKQLLSSLTERAEAVLQR